MFADVTPADPVGLISWLTGSWASTSIALLALAVLAGLAWKLSRRYGLPRIDLRGLLVMRGRASEAPPTPQPPAAPSQHQPAPENEDAATEEAPATPAAVPPPPTPQRGAAPEAAPDETPAWLAKALVVIAAVPTVLALPWAAYAVAQHLPVPLTVALPLGVLFDVAMVGAVLVALLVPSVSRQASALGWVAASAAAVAIAAYTGIGGALVFAATPLISKALWGLLITIRRQQAQQRAAHAAAEQQRKKNEEAARAAQEARDAELSDDLTLEQQRQIAEKRRQARFKLDMAAAELELEQAESEAEHQKALAEIKRIGEQRRAENRESARVYEQKLQLMRQINTLQGKKPAFLSVSDDDSDEIDVTGEITAKAGFGAETPSEFGFQRPLDVKALTPGSATVQFQDLPDHHQALVRYVHTAKEPSLREAGRRLDKDQRTIGRWADKLAELGYELPFDRKK